MNSEFAKQADEMVAQMFAQAKMQFGDAIKAHWFHDGECPGCNREIDAFMFKGKQATSLNAYIYRDRGILIGYVLCGRCAKTIMRASKRNPGVQIELHSEIEDRLKQAFEKQLH